MFTPVGQESKVPMERLSFNNFCVRTTEEEWRLDPTELSDDESGDDDMMMTAFDEAGGTVVKRSKPKYHAITREDELKFQDHVERGVGRRAKLEIMRDTYQDVTRHTGQSRPRSPRFVQIQAAVERGLPPEPLSLLRHTPDCVNLE